MIDYVLFDLDGTLTDPREGITKSVQYALDSFGIKEEELDNLVSFIGPPLKDSFMEFYGFDEAKAEAAIVKYRERFADTGIFENRIYEGIPLLIRKLKGNRKKLAVASSKPTVFVERILEHFEIRQYFDVVVGSELDGTRTDKAEVVEEALRQLYGDNRDEWDAKKHSTYMVGDRKFDIAGAKAQGVVSVAVSYGYGKMDELKIAKPDYLVKSVEELEKLLLSDSKEMHQQVTEPVSGKIWYALFPALVFYVVRIMGAGVGQFILLNILGILPDSVADKLVIKNNAGTAIEGVTGNGAAIITTIAFVITGIVCWKFYAKADIGKAEKTAIENPARLKTPVAYLCMFAAVPAMALGLNYLLELMGVTDLSEAYKQTSEMQYAAAIPLALFVNGLIAPVVEEIMFRGVIYNRLKENNKKIAAVIISSLVFAVYHQNIVQGVYAFIMGCVFAWLYECFGRFYVPVVLHIISNVFIYLLTVTGVGAALKINWFGCLSLLLIGIGMLLCCHGMNRKNIKSSAAEADKTVEAYFEK